MEATIFVRILTFLFPLMKDKLNKCPFKIGTRVRFRDSCYESTIVAATGLPLKQSETGVITSISTKDNQFVIIKNGTELWDWTLLVYDLF